MHLSLILLALHATVLIAFPGAGAQAQTVRPEAVATDRQKPWALAFLPQGRFLVTERPGRLPVVEPDGRLGPLVTGLPAIDAGGQGGLLDVITDTGFLANRRIYFCFSEPAVSGGGNSTALARATLAADNRRLEDVQLLFKLSVPFKGKVVREHKLLDGGGERIRDVRQGPDGLLYVLTDSPRGRLLRLQPG